MQLRHLKTFAAVAETLNITRAAALVHLAQSSVTEQIQALEADLGAALFDRGQRRLRLTAAGRRLLDYSAELLALADEARAAVADTAGTVAGTLIVGGLETLCAGRLPAVLAAFGQTHPAVTLGLKAAGSAELRAGLKSGSLDVGFGFGTTLGETGLRTETVAEEPLVVLVPPGHRLADRAVVGPAELTDEAFLATETGCVYRQIFETAFAGRARPRVVGEFGSLAAIRALVESGLGCALVPRLAADAAAGAAGVLAWSGPAVGLTMAWRGRRLQAPPLRLFLAAARGAFTPADVPRRHAAPFR